jgi:hypothetical protein
MESGLFFFWFRILDSAEPVRSVIAPYTPVADIYAWRRGRGFLNQSYG